MNLIIIAGMPATGKSTIAKKNRRKARTSHSRKGRRIVGGIAQEYVNRLTKRGQCFGHRTCPKHNSVTNIDPEGFKLLAIEMCREAGVDVILHVEACRVEKENGAICIFEYSEGEWTLAEWDV